MELSIIIVNWNSTEYLRKCIASIFAETKEIAFEIIVIDAASYDGCAEMLQSSYPAVRFIQSDKNLGFAHANNQAFEACSGEHVLFLNPDTELLDSAVNILYQTLTTLPRAGVVGCKLLNSDGTLQMSCVKAFPTLINQFLEFEALRRLFPRAPLWGMAPLFEKTGAPAEVDVVSGACMMMRRDVFKSLGGLATKYFMYSEDVELCLRAKISGLTNYYVPAAIIVHHGGASTAQKKASTFSSVMMLESRWRFFVSTRAPWYGWSYRMGMCAISALRAGLALVFSAVDTRKIERANWNSVVEKWWAGLRWSVGLENWVKKF